MFWQTVRQQLKICSNMAKNAPKAKGKEEILTLLNKQDPSLWKWGRDAALQLSSIEKDLFTDVREAESGNFIISGLSKKVTELDFSSFTLAISQILYNQSCKSGNEDINSGISREKSEAISKLTGSEYYKGHILTTLNEICRLAYGTEPTTEIKKKMETLIDIFHKTPVTVRYPNGDVRESYLCVTIDKDFRKKDGAIEYNLYLNPVFGSRIKNQFGLLPQNITEILDKVCKKNKQRKTAAHYILLRLLSVQDKRQPFPRTIDRLIYELRMEEYFKKDKRKAEKQLLSICTSMKEIGILNSYEVFYRETVRGKRIEKINFHLNPNFAKNDSNTMAALEETEETGDSKDKQNKCLINI